MAKNLAFGGKGKNIVVSSRVVSKKTGEYGEVTKIYFTPRMVHSAYQVRWDSGKFSKEPAKQIKVP